MLQVPCVQLASCFARSKATRSVSAPDGPIALALSIFPLPWAVPPPSAAAPAVGEAEADACSFCRGTVIDRLSLRRCAQTIRGERAGPLGGRRSERRARSGQRVHSGGYAGRRRGCQRQTSIHQTSIRQTSVQLVRPPCRRTRRDGRRLRSEVSTGIRLVGTRTLRRCTWPDSVLGGQKQTNKQTKKQTNKQPTVTGSGLEARWRSKAAQCSNP